MPFTITREEEIEEHGYCQQKPVLVKGDRYIDDSGRYCEVENVRFVRYVWEDVALWEIRITVYNRDELTQAEVSTWVK